jgi:hypothetical protein
MSLHKSMLERFTREVASSQAILVLTFLYSFDKYLKLNKDVFKASYEQYFVHHPGKWERLMYDFPRMDQSSLAFILSNVSDTLVGYRVEDLCRIGLIERSSLPPPHPKHLSITDAGIDVVEQAVDDGYDVLSPLFDHTDSPQFEKETRHQTTQRSMR